MAETKQLADLLYDGLPAGTPGANAVTVSTTAPSSPSEGDLWYDSSTGVKIIKVYNGVAWTRTNVVNPTLTNISGNILAGTSTTLTLTGTEFLTSNLVVNFTQSSDSIDADVTVTPTSDTSATVTVPSSVYSNVTSGNSVTISVRNSNGASSNNSAVTASSLPSGGTVTTSGSYRIHTFTSSDSLSVPSGFSTTAEFLVVAGGGGGAGYYGGGGGGGYRSSIAGETSGGGASLESTINLASNTTYTVTVGAGGTFSHHSDGVNPKGGDSSFIGGAVSITSNGGGGHDLATTSNFNGGSGAGGDGTNGPGSGTSGQGYSGGGGAINGITWYTAGGGGGAGGAGQTVGGQQYAGNGGAGKNSSATGSSVNYAAGGGGGCWGRYSTGYSGTAGGSSAVPSSNIAYGTDIASAPANQGGGGAGQSSAAAGSYNGGSGGSGIVIIRYQI